VPSVFAEAGLDSLLPERPQDSLKKFERPFKLLLDAGVAFHASLGKDDSREQRHYKLFNMGGKLYYTLSPRPNVASLHSTARTGQPNSLAGWIATTLRGAAEARNGRDCCCRPQRAPAVRRQSVSRQPESPIRVVDAMRDWTWERE
jgi:hypothetical protein